MKYICAFLLLGLLIFPAFAQEKRLASSPPAFRAFFLKFKTLVKNDNKTALAAITVFPFKYGFDTGDEGTMTKAQFLESYNKRFAESLKEAVEDENPLFAEGKKGVYVISTEDAAHLIFIKRRGNFKLLSFLIEP